MTGLGGVTGHGVHLTSTHNEHFIHGFIQHPLISILSSFLFSKLICAVSSLKFKCSQPFLDLGLALAMALDTGPVSRGRVGGGV